MPKGVLIDPATGQPYAGDPRPLPEPCGDEKTEEASDVEGKFSAQQSSVPPSKPIKFTHHPKAMGEESLDSSLDGSVQGKFFSGDGSKEP